MVPSCLVCLTCGLKWTAMPTFRQIGPYRLHFWSADRSEPAHVHVERDRKTAKFWLEPVRLATSRNFAQSELTKVRKMIVENETELLRFWNEHFSR
jgi:hypothetical protein